MKLWLVRENPRTVETGVDDPLKCGTCRYIDAETPGMEHCDLFDYWVDNGGDRNRQCLEDELGREIAPTRREG